MPTIVCFGDSNTHGYDASTGGRFARDVRWPGILAAALGGQADVIEEGLGGRTTLWDDPFMDGRRGADYLLPCLRSHEPVDVLVLMLGTNDLKTIFGRTAAEIASGAGSLVDMALRSGTGPDHGAPQVLLVAPPPLGEATTRSEVWGFGGARTKAAELPRLYRTIAELRGAGFLDPTGVASIDPGDGVHLDAPGHRALGLAIAGAVRTLL